MQALMCVLRRSVSKNIYDPGYHVVATERNTALSDGSLLPFYMNKSSGFTICRRTISELFHTPLIVYSYDRKWMYDWPRKKLSGWPVQFNISNRVLKLRKRRCAKSVLRAKSCRSRKECCLDFQDSFRSDDAHQRIGHAKDVITQKLFWSGQMSVRRPVGAFIEINAPNVRDWKGGVELKDERLSRKIPMTQDRREQISCEENSYNKTKDTGISHNARFRELDWLTI